jgi:hypothetical protein
MNSASARHFRAHHNEKTTRRTLIGLAALGLALTPSLGRAASVYVESSMVKVQPSASPKANSTASVSAARNEFASFQIVIRADATPIANVRATAGDLSGPGTLPAKAFALYRESLMNVTSPSGTIGKAGVYPDALIPATDEIDGQPRAAFPLAVPAGESRALWVDLLVPADAVPGVYHGSIQVTGDGLSASVPVALEVYDFTLPSTPSLSTAFLIFAGNVCRAHTGSSECANPQAAVALVNKYQALALDHRITLSNVFLQRSQGSDWSAFDQAYRPFLDGTAPTRLPGARMTSAQYTWEKTVESYRSFAQHFREKGWFDRLFDYSADEPPYGAQWSDIPTRHDLVKQADPGLKILVTTNIDLANQNGAAGDIDILVPIINHLESTVAPYDGDQRPKYDSFLSTGKKLWTYQSCMSHGCSFGGAEPGASWPSYMIDVPGVRNRLMQWADFKEKVSGELYYETAGAFGGDPWSNQYVFSGNGDGTLFYPGTPASIGGSSDVPVASIRLKLIRQGVQDFEYLTLVSKLGDRGLADQVVREVLPDAYDADQSDPAPIEAARAKLAKRILELGGGAAGKPGSGISQGTADEPAPAGSGCSVAGAPLAVLPALLGLGALLRRRGAGP